MPYACKTHYELMREAGLAKKQEDRPCSSARGYDARWRRVRMMHLRRHPLCERCGAPATDVHHVLPLRQSGKHDMDQLQSLCHSCHSRVTVSRS